MFGLAVRWSLTEAPEGVAKTLREYVQGPSLERFTGMPGLAFKVWRMREGEWFEGTYVFEAQDERDAFEASFREAAPTAAGSVVIGSAPVLIERYDVVALAEGDGGFAPGPGPIAP